MDLSTTKEKVFSVIYLFPVIISLAILTSWIYMGRGVTSSIKYVPVFLSIFILFLIMLETGPYKLKYKSIRKFVSDNRKVIALFLVLFLGSLYARLFQGLQITFLGQSLVIIGFFYGYIIANHINQKFLYNFIIGTLLFISPFIFFGVFRQEWGHGVPHHEIVYLILPVLLFPYIQYRSIKSLILSVGLLILFSYASGKNTVYLIVLLYLLFSVFLFLHKKKDNELNKIISNTITIVFSCILIVILYNIWALLYYGGEISTGNTNFRLFLYANAFERFLESPIIGNLFTVEPVHKMRSFFGASYTGEYTKLPTHSDLLDVLANGGIVFFIIFLKIYVDIFREYMSMLENNTDYIKYKFCSLLFLIVFTSCIIFSINPVFNMPVNGFTVWFMTGMLVALLKPKRVNSRSIYLINRMELNGD